MQYMQIGVNVNMWKEHTQTKIVYDTSENDRYDPVFKNLATCHKSSKFPVFGHFGPSWALWWWPKIMEILPEHSYGPKDSTKVSYVGLQWQNPHQDAPNHPNSQLLDILDLPDRPDDDKKSWKHFLSTPMVPRILQRYHM